MIQSNQTIVEMIERYVQQQKEQYGSAIFYSSTTDNSDAQIEPNNTDTTIILQEKKSEHNKPPLTLQATHSTQIHVLDSSDSLGTVSLKQTSNTMSQEQTFILPNHPLLQGETQAQWAKSSTLESLRESICNCTKCPLGTTRNSFVFGSGNPNADIVIIGEAPGADEDMAGLPFVGRSGQLLTKILDAINIRREDVFICNILKCRPPENRRPMPAEIEQCEPYLFKQLELLQPTFILALGLTAVDTLFKNKFKMADVRGTWMNYHGLRTMVTYHPSALLRNPEWKKLAWQDVQRLRDAHQQYCQTGQLPTFS